MYGNSLALADALGEPPYAAPMRAVFWAEPAAIRRRVTPAAVEQAWDSPDVRNRPNVRHGLTKLRDDLAS